MAAPVALSSNLIIALNLLAGLQVQYIVNHVLYKLMQLAVT